MIPYIIAGAIGYGIAKLVEKDDNKKYAEGGLVVKNNSDLEEVAKHFTNAVKKHRWDLKDLIHYFEKDNNFDYKKRVKIWEDMNGYEMPKTYNNIYEMLKRISEANGSKFADGGEAGNKLISIARAIFNPNEDNGKIATSFGKKTFDGFVEMIKQNDAYDIYYNIWQENAEGKYIATTYGDKTYIGLLEMLKSAKNEEGGHLQETYIIEDIEDVDIRSSYTEKELKKYIEDWNRNMETNYQDWKDFNNGEEYYRITPLSKYDNGGELNLLSNKFTEAGYDTYARNFGVAQIGGFNDEKDINILVSANILDMYEATGEEEFEDKPIVLILETHAYPEFWSDEYAEKIKDMVGDDTINPRTIDYLSDAHSYGLGVPLSTDADGMRFETEEEAIKFLNSKKLNDQISGLGFLSGFHFDKQINRIGDTGWKYLSEQVGANYVEYAKGGEAGKYSIIVWETEEDRDAGESFVAEILTNKQEALEKAEKMYYKQDFSAIEVIDENDEVILHLSSNDEDEE